MKYAIIGGVAGGATAAARLRRIDEQAEIILLEKGKYISYANCGLPYYIGGVIAEREKHKKRDASSRTHLHYNHIIFKVLSIPTTYYQPIFSSPAALYQAMER